MSPRTVVSVFFFFFFVSLFSLPPFSISAVQLTTPPHCNFCVTLFTNTHTHRSSTHSGLQSWCMRCHVRRAPERACSFLSFLACAFLFQLYLLDSCSLYCLTSFLPPLALPGALAAVISMFSSKSPWKRRGGMGLGKKREWKRENRKLIFKVMGHPLAVAREARG